MPDSQPTQTTEPALNLGANGSDGLNTAQSIAATLRDEILRGVHRPGDRLPAERDLASRLSVNRASVREALKQLEQLGLVRIRRGGGTHVCHLYEASLDIVKHLLHVEGDLDPALALQILDVNEIMVAGATRLALERASDSQLLEARALIRELGEAGTEVPRRLLAVDGLFELITRASDNLVLRLIHNAIRPTLRGELGALCWRIMNPDADQLQEHLHELDAAIIQRDAPRAEEATRTMLRARRQRLFQYLFESDSVPRLSLDAQDGPHNSDAPPNGD